MVGVCLAETKDGLRPLPPVIDPIELWSARPFQWAGAVPCRELLDSVAGAAGREEPDPPLLLNFSGTAILVVLR